MDHPREGSSKPQPEVGFAPKDLTDGRMPGDWKSRYDSAAWLRIRIQGGYLLSLLAGSVVVMVIVWLGYPASWFRLSAARAATLANYGYSWLGGTIGGVLFALKWLYHSIAKGSWHVDRSPWRYLTPHISGGLAFGTVAILNSFVAAGQNTAMSGTRSIAMGILVGLFSDNALAKLTEVAETLLGPTRRPPPPRLPDPTTLPNGDQGDNPTK
jgi:hypothetical protein